jgi:hypothetical protein
VRYVIYIYIYIYIYVVSRLRVNKCIIKQPINAEHIQTNRLLQLLCTYPSAINHTLTKFRQLFHTLEMMKMLNYCFMQLYTPC